MVFDFRGLYPSIIIAYNIDPATLMKGTVEGTAYNESPTKAKFRKEPMGISPKGPEDTYKREVRDQKSIQEGSGQQVACG